MDIQFKNLEELYSRVKPALYSKIMEFRRRKIDYIKEEDIWNYLSIYVWKKADSLDLASMVSSIMEVREEDIKAYVHGLLREQNRELEKEDGNIL